MVVENLQHLAPEEADPLREIVNDLGPLGDAATELGADGRAVSRVLHILYAFFVLSLTTCH